MRAFEADGYLGEFLEFALQGLPVIRADGSEKTLLHSPPKWQRSGQNAVAFWSKGDEALPHAGARGNSYELLFLQKTQTTGQSGAINQHDQAQVADTYRLLLADGNQNSKLGGTNAAVLKNGVVEASDGPSGTANLERGAGIGTTEIQGINGRGDVRHSA
jgi:hypothetical protein